MWRPDREGRAVRGWIGFIEVSHRLCRGLTYKVLLGTPDGVFTLDA